MANTVSIDIILNGLRQIDDLAQAIRKLGNATAADGRRAASGISQIEKAATSAGGALDDLSHSQTKANTSTRGIRQNQEAAARAQLQHAQATARLQQAQGNTAAAIRTLQGALKGVNTESVAAVRVQIQLANLQNNYANSPLIGALRGQADALRTQTAAAANAAGTLQETAQAATKAGASFSDTVQAIFAQAEALSQLQHAQGDAAGAAKTLAAGLQEVQRIETEGLDTNRIGPILQFAASLLNLSSSLVVFSTTTGIGLDTLNEKFQRFGVNASVLRPILQGFKNIAGLLTGAIHDTAGATDSAGAAAAEASHQFTDLADTIEETKDQSDRLKRAAQGPLLSALDEELARLRRAAQASTKTQADIRREALQELTGAAERFQYTGKEAGDSFATGLKQAANAVKKSGEATGEAAERGIRDALEQRSPSRVLLRLGKEAAESFAAGFAVGKAKLKAITGRDLVTPNITQGQNAFAQIRRSFDSLAAALSNSTLGQVFGGLRDRVGNLVFEFKELAATAIITVGAIGALGIAGLAAVPALFLLGKAGVEANRQFEQTRIGIASVVASVGTLRNAQGVKLEGVEALNAALPIARKQLDLLRVDALRTALTFEQIAPAFLQAVGPGLAAGLDLDTIRKTVISLSQLIGPLTGDASQLGQELRAIFSGDIGPDAQIARTLQLRREDIEAAKEQGRLAELLNERLKVAAATGQLVSNTFEAATSNLRDAGTILAGAVTTGLFERLTISINTLLPQIFEAAFGKVALAPAFRGIEQTLSEVFNRLGSAAEFAIKGTLQAVAGISAFLAQNSSVVGLVVESIFKLFELLGRSGLAISKLVGGLLSLSATMTVVNTVVRIAIEAIDQIPLILEIVATIILKLVRAFDSAFGGILRVVSQIGIFALAVHGVRQAIVFFTPLLLNWARGLALSAISAFQAAFSVAGLTAAVTTLRVALTVLFTTTAGWTALAGVILFTVSAFDLLSTSATRAQEAAAKIKFEGLQEQAELVATLREQLAQAQQLTAGQGDLNTQQERFLAILNQLPASQQEVINKLGTQEEKTKALSRAIQEALRGQENAARAQQVTLSLAIATRQQEITQTQQRIEQLDEELRKRKELLQLGQRTTEQIIGAEFGEALILTEDVAEAERRLAEERNKANDDLRDRQKLLQEDINKLGLTARTLKQTEDALLAARRAGGLTTEQFNAFKTALDNARASGVGISQIVSDIGAALDNTKSAAERAKAALQNFFDTGETAELQKKITGAINKITAETVRAGGNSAQALSKLNQALKENRDGIADDTKTLTAAQKIQKALQDRLNPPQRTGGGRTTPARAAAVEATSEKQLRESQLTLEKAFSDRVIALQRARSEQEKAILDRQLEERTISLTEYYARRADLIVDDATREIDAIKDVLQAERDKLAELEQSERKQLAKTRKASDRAKIEAATAVERNKITADTLKLEVDLAQVEAKGAADSEDNARRRIKSLRDLRDELAQLNVDFLRASGDELGAQLADIDRRFAGILATAKTEFGEFSEQVKTILRLMDALRTQASVQAAAREVSRIDAESDFARTALQNQVLAGLLTERQARQQNLALARAYVAQVLPALDEQIRLQKELTGAQSAEVLQLETKRLALEQLTIDTESASRRIKRALEDGLLNVLERLGDDIKSVGDLFRELANTILREIKRIAAEKIIDAIFGNKQNGQQGGQKQGLVGQLLDLFLGGRQQGQQRSGGIIDAAAGVEGEDTGGAAGGTFADRFNGFFEGFFGKLQGVFSKVTTGFGDLFGGLLKGLGGAASSIFGLIAQGVGAIFGKGFGFAGGGFTGAGARFAPAGIVHAGEFVFSAPSVANLGVGFLDNLHAASRRGFADGGFAGSLVEPSRAGGSNSSAAGQNTTVIVAATDDELEQALHASRARGDNVRLEFISRNRQRIKRLLD